jgi:hypothetical protein
MGMAKTANAFSRYTRATTELYQKQRLIGLSIGEPGSRKTSFWLEAPGPIVVFSLDQGMEGVVDRVLRDSPDKEIYVKEYEWMPTQDTSQEEAIELRDRLTDDFEHAIQIARTVVWDKEGDIWEMFRYAEFGSPNDAPRNYPALNQRYRRLINMPKATDVNFGVIEGMKDEWGSKVNQKTGAQGAASTGRRIRAGFGELDGLVHLVLTHAGVSPSDWSLSVGKARGPGGHEVAGQTFSNLTFQELAMQIFPDSDEGDWV